MTYTIFRPTGDYYPRQDDVKAAGAKIHIEVHCNGSTNPQADGAYSIVSDPPTLESIALARELARVAAEVAPHERVRHGGVQVGGDGSGNVDPARTGCPSALWEPGFVSNADFDDWLREGGCAELGRVLAKTIRGALPHGGVVSLSVGHVGRTSHPDDRGAPRIGGGWEADAAEEIVAAAVAILRGEAWPR